MPWKKNGCGRKKGQTKKATGLRRKNTFGDPFFSVCGLLCGQSVDHLSLLSQNATKCKEKPPFSHEKGGFLELLGGFEPPTSSLPTGWEPSSPCVPTLSGHFCSKRMRSAALLCPLLPSAHFPVWVSVWVKANYCPPLSEKQINHPAVSVANHGSHTERIASTVSTPPPAAEIYQQYER